MVFLAAEALSLFGNAAIGIVLPWLVLTRTGDPAGAAAVAAAAGIPAILASLLGGWLVDHVGQRRMSIIADLGSAVSVAGLAVVDLVFGLDLGWFIVLGILGALFDVPGMTARETLMARVSRTSGWSLERLAGLRQAVFGLSFLAGPAIAGLLLAALPAIQVVWLTAACSLGAALCMTVLPLAAPVPVGGPAREATDPVPTTRPGLLRRLVAGSGLTLVRGDRTLRAMLIVGFASTVVTAPLLAVLLPTHFQRMGQPDLFGFTMSGFAVGSLVGSVLYAVIAPRSRVASWLLAIALTTVGMAGFASLQGFWLVAAGSFLVGLGSSLLNPMFMVYFSEQVPEALRGRVLGLFNALALLASPLALGILGLVLQVSTINGAAWGVVALWIGVGAYCLASPALRAFVAGPAPAGDDAEKSSEDDESERVTC